MTVRAALILGLSLIIGAIAGVLAYWATSSAPGGFLGAGTAAAGAIGLLNQIISNAPEENGE
ncbi:hypothetical protein ACWEPC_36290 [Nonomuraea sp. NPDC004297]